jgi:hypothetical protein
MKNLLKKANLDVTGIVVDIALVVVLIPVIKTFVSAANNCHLANFPIDNTTVCALSGTEVALLALTTLFIVLALVFMIVKQSGIGKKE